MDQLLGSLKNLIRAKNVTIDDMLFRLHYRATLVVLLAGSLLVTGKSLKKNLEYKTIKLN